MTTPHSRTQDSRRLLRSADIIGSEHVRTFLPHRRAHLQKHDIIAENCNFCSAIVYERAIMAPFCLPMAVCPLHTARHRQLFARTAARAAQSTQARLLQLCLHRWKAPAGGGVTGIHQRSLREQPLSGPQPARLALTAGNKQIPLATSFPSN